MHDSRHARNSSLQRHRREHGYVLLTLLLMTALLIIAAAAVLPAISFELRRDREEELIHRGVQYSRAIRAYYKKFGRYPARIEDLESTNNLRFLRKRYKDPMNCPKSKCQDFKLLHFGEVRLTLSGGLVGGQGINGASPLNNPGGFGAQTGGFAGGGGLNPQATGFGAAANNPPGANSNVVPPTGQTADSASGQTDPSSPQTQVSQSGQNVKETDTPNAQVFGGAPIVGVISSSKKASIREFNHKRKYSEWQFIYDPATDRGGLLNTPNQPPLQGFGTQPGQMMQQGSPNSSPFGAQPGQGNYPGQTNPNPTNPSAPEVPAPPSNPPNQ